MYSLLVFLFIIFTSFIVYSIPKLFKLNLKQKYAESDTHKIKCYNPYTFVI